MRFAFIALLLPSPLVAQSPAECMRASWADNASLPNAHHYRYAVKPQRWSDKDWQKYLPAIVGHLHQLSRSPVHYKLGSVDMLVRGPILRVNVHKLGYADVWDKLQDPYLTKKVWYGRYKLDKSWEWLHYKVVPSQMLMEDAEDEKKLNALMEWTGSYAPMVRADWLLNQTLAAANRDVGYPEFLRFKDKKEFEALGGFDKGRAKGFRFELRDAVGLSGVTLQPRAIARYDALGGGYWYSIDFKKDSPVLNQQGEQIEDGADAFETYIPLPNGLWAMGAFDGKGALARAVPGDIANDHFSRSNDKQIHMGISCIRCHGDGGLKPIDAFYRTILGPPLKGDLTDYDPKKLEKDALRLEQQYLRPLKGFLEKDKVAYELAVLECTGLKSGEYAKLLSELWERYEDARVNTAYVAEDFGMEEEVFRDKLLKAIKGGVKDAYGYPVPIPPTVGAFVHKGGRAQTVGIRQFEKDANKIYEILRAVK